MIILQDYTLINLKHESLSAAVLIPSKKGSFCLSAYPLPIHHYVQHHSKAEESTRPETPLSATALNPPVIQRNAEDFLIDVANWISQSQQEKGGKNECDVIGGHRGDGHCALKL